jgi:hypothetical protein
MAFSSGVRLEALIKCQRRCCLCGERKHTKIECHHILPEADGGGNEFENCIPLCFDCHGEVMAYNPRHPKGTKYTSEELTRRRNDFYAAVEGKSLELGRLLHADQSLYCDHNPDLIGSAAFNYSNHDGYFRIGTGNNEFLTRWAKSGNTDIHFFGANVNVRVAVAPKGSRLADLKNVSLLDYSSRDRNVKLNQFAVLENHRCRFAALLPINIQDDRYDNEDELVLRYWILSDGSDDFSSCSE